VAEVKRKNFYTSTLPGGKLQNMLCLISFSVGMDVGRIFSRGGHWGFSKIFPGGAKVVKFVFFPLETKKQLFFAKLFKIQGFEPPFFRRPLL